MTVCGRRGFACSGGPVVRYTIVYLVRALCGGVKLHLAPNTRLARTVFHANKPKIGLFQANSSTKHRTSALSQHTKKPHGSMVHLVPSSHDIEVESGGQGLTPLFVLRSVASFKEFLVPSMDGGCMHRGGIGVSDAFRFLEDETFPEDSFCHLSTKHVHADSTEVFWTDSYSSGSMHYTIVEIDANLPPLSAMQSALSADTRYDTRSLPDIYRRATDLLGNSVVASEYRLGQSFYYKRVAVHGVAATLGEILNAVSRKEGLGLG